MKNIIFMSEFLGLLFPRLCHACGRALFVHEPAVCSTCIHQLPRTKFHLDPESNADQIFWGRTRIEKASACFYYTRNSKVQKMIHDLKYRGHKKIGITIGELYGKDLKFSRFYRDINMIIPVPLHPGKKRKRGFNQSELIARGLSSALDKPVNTGILYRRAASQTQTRKSRYSRWKNVEGVFVVKNPKQLENKHILLVDDVITTGSTIEACANALHGPKNLRISVAAIGFATH